MLDCEALLWYVYFDETNHHNRRNLAWAPYTTFLKNSKMNLLFLEKATNAESGLSTRSSRSSFPLLPPRLPICCVACKRFSALPAYPKNAFTPSWLHQRYLGGGCGNRYGRWFLTLWQMAACFLPWMTISIRRRERRSSAATRSSIMPPNRISRDIHGRKTLWPSAC